MQAVTKADELFVFHSSHRIVYNTKNPIPIKEMIIALQGLDGLLKSLPKLLEATTGIDIERGEFQITRLESGSMIEDIAIAIVFKDKAKYEAFIEKIGGNSAMRATLITAGIAALIGYGLYQATSGKTVPHITANNNVIFNIGAGEVGLTPEAFTAIVKAAVVDKKGVAESALRFVGPARSDPGSTVTVGDESGVAETRKTITFQAAAIAEAPARIELEANERIEEFKSAQLIIRATNLDSKKLGWAGRLAPREDRLPIELDPAVAESEIFGRTSITVDAALVYKEKGKSRELKPARIYVRRVIK